MTTNFVQSLEGVAGILIAGQLKGAPKVATPIIGSTLEVAIDGDEHEARRLANLVNDAVATAKKEKGKR